MKVLEVAMEIAYPPDLLSAVFSRHGFRPVREVAMSSSVGGIGPLLRERIIAQAEIGVEVIGVSLLYENTWIQKWFDWGQLHLEKREVLSTLREFLQDTGLVLSVPLYDGQTVAAHVWRVIYGKTAVYFLDCPPITQVVYPGEEDAPSTEKQPVAWAAQALYQQNALIGRGALALAKALQFQPDFIVLSETPTVLGHHRLVQDAFHDDPFFQQTRYIFNDHTPLEYAHPIWPRALIDQLRLDTSAYAPLPGAAEKGDVDVTRWIVGAADGVFGVSQKHGRVMRAMPSLKDYAAKIDAITNGIYVPFWRSPDYAAVNDLSDDALLELKKRHKLALLDWVWRHFGLWHTWKEQVRDKTVVLWTRRLTGYKRMDLLWRLCKEPAMRRQLVEANIVLLIGGRIHQHDDQAQTMIYNLLDLMAVEPVLQERIVFLDNFNVWMAPRLFQGADAAIMLADDGREAAATGFMKAQVNGGIILATEDGAIPESVVFASDKTAQTANGFEVPYRQGHPTTEGLLRALKALQQIIEDPARHAAMVRAAFAAEKQVSLDRTAKEMKAFYERLQSADSAPAPHPV